LLTRSAELHEPEDRETNADIQPQSPKREGGTSMYIGLGTLIVILVIIAIIYLVRRV
jgi:hypothetical protein